MLSFDKEGLRTKVEVQRSGSHSSLAHVTAGTGVNLSTTQGPPLGCCAAHHGLVEGGLPDTLVRLLP